jgi:tetratricopeptide (TPR) repeat protein
MTCARMIPLLLILAASGCAPVARLQTFRPAAHDLTGIERIAILDFDAAAGKSPDLRQSVVAALTENRSYTLVEPAVLENVHPIRGPDGRTDRTAALDAAHQAGVDAVLACAEVPGGQLRAELIDADTADVLVAPTAKDAHELTAKLAPNYVPVDVTLARQWWGEGKASVAAGNALARQGDWIAAAEKWEEARKANPANHAALHNLALAAEARQNYREAFTLLDQALDQFPLKLYHQTRKSMEQRQTTFLAAAKQVDAIRAAALAHTAPPGLPTILPAGYAAPQEAPSGDANQ